MRKLLGLLLLVLGCGANHGDAFLRAIDAGQAAEARGRYGEAAERYDEAARTARIDKDRDYARFLAASMLRRSGDRSGAASILATLAAASPPGEETAAAAYALADMRIEDDPAGWDDLLAVLSKFPDSGVGRPALRRIVAHRDATDGEEKTLAFLRQLGTTLGRTERGEEIAYEIAAHEAATGDPRGARDAFVLVAHRWAYPHGALFDDALYRASEEDEKLGRYSQAIADLEELLAVREHSFLVGSYERPRFDAAALRIGVLYRDRLGDRARARAAFHRLYAEFKTSLLRGEALWDEASLWKDDGDLARSCDTLRTLVGEFRDSRYVPCARERCPAIPLPEGKNVVRTCHAYIERGGR